MDREIALVGAPTSLGSRLYDDGQVRDVDRAPSVLRERGLVARLGAVDFGDVMPAPYRDFVRPPHHARNEKQVAEYSHHLAHRVAEAAFGNRFVVALGGDCSVLLGCLLGARKATGGEVGLLYVDAHADFATSEESATGSIAGMSLALALGRGNAPLAILDGRKPLVAGTHVALVGRRKAADNPAALEASALLDLPSGAFRTKSAVELGTASLTRVASAPAGFWVQLDVDVLNPIAVPAVGSREPGGPTPGQLIEFLAPIVHHPHALGLSLTTYDPAFDADRSCARLLVGMLETLARRHALTA